MTGRGRIGLGCAVLLWAAPPAFAQRSLFDQPVAQPDAPATPTPSTPAPAPSAPPGTAPAPAAEAPATPKRKVVARPKGPVPARTLAINNASDSTLATLEVTSDGKAAKLARPLKAKGRTSLKLPAFKSCNAEVSYGFEGGAPLSSEIDICKEKSLRLTDG